MPFLSDRKDVKNFVSYTYNWKLQEALILRKIYAGSWKETLFKLLYMETY